VVGEKVFEGVVDARRTFLTEVFAVLKGQTPVIFEFGAFRLDPAERLVSRHGQPVSLTPKAFDLLVYLVDHRGKLVEKSTLMAALWPDTIVEEANLAFQISTLRKGLDDGGGGGTLIQTVPTKGYRFVGEVTRLTVDAPTGVLRSPHRSVIWGAAGVLATVLVVAAAVYLARRSDVGRRNLARWTIAAVQPRRGRPRESLDAGKLQVVTGARA
jgi:DNA-binding winged helix-turn-helix (wHTH) protein